MDLKKFFPTNLKKEEDLKKFLAIEIHESLVKSATWQMDADNNPEIISLGSFELWDSQESLLNGIDASLTSAVKDLPIQPKEIIFGLPESWLEDNKIHPSKTNLIKQIIKELNLKPIGMVTIAQAIIQHLKNTEGVPPTATLLEIYPTKAIVTVVKLGKIKASEEVGRSGDLAKDVEEALTRIDTDQFPPRFLLTNGSNLENEQQQLVSHSWQEKLPFLHLPKVEILPIDFSIKAVALAGGIEAAKINTPSKQKEENIINNNISGSTKEKKSVPPEDFRKMGFDLEDEILKQKSPPPSKQIDNHSNVKTLETSVQNVSTTKTVSSKKTKTFNLSTFFIQIKKTIKRLPIFKQKLLYPLLFLVILLITSVYYLIFSRAEITLNLPTRSIQETKKITIFSSSDQKGDVYAETKTISSKTNQSINTTGESLVGDKATGKISIYNRTSDTITLEAGEEIISDNSELKFLIDTEVTIASKSSDLISGEEKYGKSIGVSITASRIGADYNLSQEESFVVGQYSKTIVYAISEGDFVGGSSRTVKAVSQEDQDNLLLIAQEEIEQNLESQINQENNDLIPIVIENENESDNQIFSHQIGEEADTLKIELSAQNKILLVSREKLINFLNQDLQETSSKVSTLSSKRTKFDFGTLKEVSLGRYETELNIDGVIIPQIETETLKEQISGSLINVAQNEIKQNTSSESIKIEIRPRIPFLKKILPVRKNNIKITISN